MRVAAYTGLRRGELVALRWRDVDFIRCKIVVQRAVSADVEATSTKSRRRREVPLPDQAAGALDRLSQRGDFTSPDDYVFVNRLGRRLEAPPCDAASSAPGTPRDCGRCASTTSATPTAPARCRRRRPRIRQSRDGPFPHHDHRALPPCPVGQRAGRPVHARARPGPALCYCSQRSPLERARASSVASLTGRDHGASSSRSARQSR